MAVPGGLKRALLPAWNAGHRLARWASLYLDALRHRRFERCTVCGRSAPMLYYRGVIPPRLEELWELSPRLADALARKESCLCGWCGAKLRARRLAQTLLATIPAGGARSVAAWVQQPEARALRVAEINRIEGLHDTLLRLPLLTFSDFDPDTPPGSVTHGVRCEDLTHLTYPDASFDVVLTSETLEHVPDLDRALREIHRVLVPGGWHLFTVPLLPHVRHTFARTLLKPDGSLDHCAPAIRHPGGDGGYLVFTEIGADLPDLLQRAGFTVRMEFGPVTEDDLGQVFVTQKLPERSVTKSDDGPSRLN